MSAERAEPEASGTMWLFHVLTEKVLPIQIYCQEIWVVLL